MRQFTIKDTQGKLILFATILASGMAFLDGSVVNIAIPTLQSKLHATITDVQWIVNGYALFLCSLLLISGALGDRFGRKKIFLAGIVVFILSSLLCGISQTTRQLILFRMLEGVGGAMMVPGSLSIIDAAFQEKTRGAAIGIWSGFSGGLAALGPFVGGWLVQALGWQSIFYINIPLGLVAVFITWRYVPEMKSATARRADIPGALFIFLSLLGITYGLITGPVNGWSNATIWGSMLGGFLFLILFVIAEVREKEPLVPLNMFKSSLVAGANLVTFFLYFALSGVIFFLVLNFQQIQHYPPILAGLGLLPPILLITFLSGPAGFLADRIGPRIPMIIGPLIVAIGMFLLTLSGLHANYFQQYMPGLIMFGLGMSLVIAPLTKSALAVDQRFSGAASGVNNAVARVAGLLAVALLGAIMFSLFTTQLQNRITSSGLPTAQQHQILSQGNKMAGIEIPRNLDSHAKMMSQTAIEDAFIYAFRRIMAINVFLAFSSAVVSFFLIKNKK